MEFRRLWLRRYLNGRATEGSKAGSILSVPFHCIKKGNFPLVAIPLFYLFLFSVRDDVHRLAPFL